MDRDDRPEEEEDEVEGEGENVPWLRDMVDDELLGLFSENSRQVARTARSLVAMGAEDPAIVGKLIDALETSLLHGNDETQATVFISLILGEIRSRDAVPVLLRALGSEDETLQQSAEDALLRIGAPSIDRLMDAYDEEPSAQFTEAGYRLLGNVGSLHDEDLLQRTRDFLFERAQAEEANPHSEHAIERLFQASAFLGDRRMMAVMDRVLRSRFRGMNAAIQDSRDMLSENTQGLPLVHDKPPWIEPHRWLFEEDLESARVNRKVGGGRKKEDTAGEEEETTLETEDGRLSSLYWGLNATLERGGRDPLDARRFIERPGGRPSEEEDGNMEADEPEEDGGDGRGGRDEE